MIAKIYPSKTIIEANLMGSKSLTHRFLIASFLSSSHISFSNIALNDDCKATMECLEKLGAKINLYGVDSCYVTKEKKTKEEVLELDCKASASTLRFLLPLSLHFAKKVIFKCDESLYNRPLTIYENIAKQSNCIIKKENGMIICSGSLDKDYIELDVSISSQFITGLIINSLYLNQALTIKINGKIESIDYIKMTVDVFNKCGYKIDFNDNEIIVHKYNENIWDDFILEGDYSSASYLIALGVMNGSYSSTNLKENSIQPDAKIVSILKNMKASIRFIDSSELYASNNSLLEKGFKKQLENIEIDISNCIDLGPLLMVIGAYSKGKMILTNVARLRYKESNRLDKMIDILKSLNVDIKYENDSVIINGKKDYSNNITIDCPSDHRIVMALTCFALMNNGVISLTNVECVSKSFPNFFEILTKSTKQNAIQIN